MFEFIHPDDRPAVMEEFRRAPTARSSGHVAFRYRHKDGGWRWLESTEKPFRAASEKLRAVIASRDITERKRAEEQIKASLKEKEILLKEIYHRVKNNLQLISSMLNLQLQYLKDGRAREIFNKTRNRIRSMSIVHELLYRSKSLAKVDCVEYIQSVANNLLYSYKVNSDVVQLNIDVEDASLRIDTAQAFGIITADCVGI